MAHRNSESGFALIEVIVSAAVLAIMAMAVLSGIDAASNSSAREKARAVAASLAEQDQERMRAMSVETLAGLNETRAVPVDGVSYTVKSEAKWVTDDQGGTPSCGNSSKNNEYLHISTTVTSKIVGKNVKSIKVDSLVAPSVVWSSTHGILGVKVVDRNGVGVTGVTVSPKLASPAFAPSSSATDASGCAIFRQIPIGTYSIEISKSGYVDPEGKPIPVASQKVSPGVVTFKTLDFDIATRADVTVTTNVPGSPNTAQVSKATAISATNAKRISLLRNFPNATGANPITAASLYPFKDSAYAFFTGNCAYQNPETLGRTDYFKNNTGSLVADPTKSQPQGPVIVRQPPFNLRVNRSGTLTVYAKLRKPAAFSTDACVEPRVQMALKAWPSPPGTWGTQPSGAGLWVVRNDATFDPGMPYGTYEVCVSDTAPSPDVYQTFDYDNTVVGGQASTVANSGTWRNGSCPL
jgi:type II secretory pathway pseudopilin PulG